MLGRRTVCGLLAGAFWSIAVGAPLESCTRGQTLFSAQKYVQAQEALWECVLAGAKDTEAAHQLALTYRELKNYDSGFGRAKSALAGKPGSVDLLYVTAFIQFRMGRHHDSIGLLGQAYRLNHFDWRVHQLFALNYVVLNIKDGALAEFQNAIALNPQNAELHYQLARFYYSDGRVRESIEESRRALAIFPEYPEAYENLGLCYEALGDNQSAAENFERAIALTGKLGWKDEWPFLDYAEFLMKQDNVEASIPLLRQALEVNPASAKGNYYMGRAMRKLNRNTEARRFLEQSLKLDSSDPAPYFELGMLYIKEGERERAKPLLERFQELRKREQPSNGNSIK